jgi:O-antigen/teichoic acid export membrane protein
MSGLKNNILSTSATLILNTAISFVSSVFLSRILGAVGRGEMAIFNSSLNFFTSFLEFGLSASVIYFIASNKISGSKLLNFNILFILISLIFVILIIGIVDLTGYSDLILPGKYSTLGYYFIFILLFILTKSNSVFNCFLLAKKGFAASNIISLVINILTLIFYMIIFYSFINLENNFAIIVYTTLAAALLNFVILFRSFYLAYRPIHFNLGDLLTKQQYKDIALYGGMDYLANFFQFLSYRLDFWFIDYFQGKAELGVYSLAVSLVQLLWIIPKAIASVLFSYNSSPEDNANSWARTALLCKFSFYICLVLGIGGSILSYWLVPILYGKEFASAAYMITILLIGIVPFCLSVVIASYNAGHDKNHLNMIGALIGVAVCIPLNFLLIPKYGAIGAAIATGVSYTVNTCFLVYNFLTSAADIKALFYIKKEELKFINFKKITSK